MSEIPKVVLIAGSHLPTDRHQGERIGEIILSHVPSPLGTALVINEDATLTFGGARYVENLIVGGVSPSVAYAQAILLLRETRTIDLRTAPQTISADAVAADLHRTVQHNPFRFIMTPYSDALYTALNVLHQAHPTLRFQPEGRRYSPEWEAETTSGLDHSAELFSYVISGIMRGERLLMKGQFDHAVDLVEKPMIPFGVDQREREASFVQQIIDGKADITFAIFGIVHSASIRRQLREKGFAVEQIINYVEGTLPGPYFLSDLGMLIRAYTFLPQEKITRTFVTQCLLQGAILRNYDEVVPSAYQIPTDPQMIDVSLQRQIAQITGLIAKRLRTREDIVAFEQAIRVSPDGFKGAVHALFTQG